MRTRTGSIDSMRSTSHIIYASHHRRPPEVKALLMRPVRIFAVRNTVHQAVLQNYGVVMSLRVSARYYPDAPRRLQPPRILFSLVLLIIMNGPRVVTRPSRNPWRDPGGKTDAKNREKGNEREWNRNDGNDVENDLGIPIYR